MSALSTYLWGMAIGVALMGWGVYNHYIDTKTITVHGFGSAVSITMSRAEAEAAGADMCAALVDMGHEIAPDSPCAALMGR